MRIEFGVRRPRRVRSPRVSKGSLRKRALPHGRASDTITAILAVCLAFIQPAASFAQRRPAVTVTVDTSRPIKRFTPAHALGAAIDGHEKGINDLQLTPDNIKAMLSAGLRPLTYRLRTELGIAVWHWNPQGSQTISSAHPSLFHTATICRAVATPSIKRLIMAIRE